MRKLSQKELLEEGFLDIVRGAGKAAMRGAVAATKGIAKTISPTGAGIIGAAADTVGAAIGNIAASSPAISLKAFLSRPENRRLFRNYKINKETNLENGDRAIEITGEFVNPNTQAVTPVTTNVIFQRVDSGGIGPEKWSPISEFDVNTGQFQIKQKKTGNKQATTTTTVRTPKNNRRPI